MRDNSNVVNVSAVNDTRSVDVISPSLVIRSTLNFIACNAIQDPSLHGWPISPTHLLGGEKSSTIKYCNALVTLKYCNAFVKYVNYDTQLSQQKKGGKNNARRSLSY